MVTSDTDLSDIELLYITVAHSVADIDSVTVTDTDLDMQDLLTISTAQTLTTVSAMVTAIDMASLPPSVPASLAASLPLDTKK